VSWKDELRELDLGVLLETSNKIASKSGVPFEDVVKPVIEFLHHSLNFDEDLFTNVKRYTGKKADEVIKKVTESIISGYLNRPTNKEKIEISTADDPAILKLINTIASDLNPTELQHFYRIVNRITTLHGSVLEEFIHTELQNNGDWFCAWGETVKNTDFFNIKNYKMIQVKNKSTTANADARKNLKRLQNVGYDLKFWCRMNSKTGKLYWNDLNKILGLSNESSKLTEQKYMDYLDSLVAINSDIFDINNPNLIPNNAILSAVEAGRKIHFAFCEVLDQYSADDIPKSFFMKHIDLEFVETVSNTQLSIRAIGVIFSTLKAFSTMHDKNWENLVESLREKIPNLPLELKGMTGTVGAVIAKDYLGTSLEADECSHLWVSEDTSNSFGLDEFWKSVFTDNDLRLLRYWNSEEE
jgi:hypothetical protein